MSLLHEQVEHTYAVPRVGCPRRSLAQGAARRAEREGPSIRPDEQHRNAARAIRPLQPAVCPADITKDVFPAFDAKAASQQLDAAGWKAGTDGVRSKDGKRLTLSVLYPASEGARMVASMEHVQTAWTKIGVDVQLAAGSDAQIGQVLDETGDFDVHFVNTGLNLPSQLVPFVSGPGTPDGPNAGQIDNPDYTAKAKAAMDKAGIEGCADLNAAESALYKRADLIPFANQQRVWFSKKAIFDLALGVVVPSSIRCERTDGTERTGAQGRIDQPSPSPLFGDYKGLSHVMIVRMTSSAVCDSTVIRA